MVLKRESRKCLSCGATLPTTTINRNRTQDAVTDPLSELCSLCQITRASMRDMMPTDECPRCHATKVLPTSSRTREQILVCAHCDHIWSRIRL
jgi:DNA-directed RNA polymerase subunit M/transcription elongation factor TFIIS